MDEVFFRGYEIFERRHTRSLERDRIFIVASHGVSRIESKWIGRRRNEEVYLPRWTNREVNQNGELSINKQPLSNLYLYHIFYPLKFR